MCERKVFSLRFACVASRMYYVWVRQTPCDVGCGVIVSNPSPPHGLFLDDDWLCVSYLCDLRNSVIICDYMHLLILDYTCWKIRSVRDGWQIVLFDVITYLELDFKIYEYNQFWQIERKLHIHSCWYLKLCVLSLLEFT